MLNMHCARQPLSLLIDLTGMKDDDYRLMRLLLMLRQNEALHYRIHIYSIIRCTVLLYPTIRWGFKTSAFPQSG